MKLTIDTSVIMAVLLNEPERKAILSTSKGHDLIAPTSLPIEVGNAISLAFKKKRIDLETGIKIFSNYKKMRIRLIPIDLENAITICHESDIYAYDAYMLEVSEREKTSLLSLDRKLNQIAESRGIILQELTL